MRFSTLVFLSFGAVAAGFSFTGLPSSATVNTASSATLNRNSGDPTSFSLILRLVQQNGGSTIKTFQSEQGSSIPFSFTPTQTGSFIIEVISNLQPISDKQQPDQIFASSSGFNVVAADNNDQLSPTTTSSSDSDNTSTSSSSANTVVVSSTAPSSSQTTAGSNPQNTAQTSSTSSTKDSSNRPLNSSASSTVSTTTPFFVTTNEFSSPTGSSGNGQSALASGSSPSSVPVSSSPGSTSGISPGSTETSSPTGATSHSSSKTGMIVGIVFGVLTFIAICLALLIAFMRNRRRKRTSAFERLLMFRPAGSSALVFDNMTPSMDGGGPDGEDMVERGLGPNGRVLSGYSQQSVPSQYSDSPSIFYTAVPRTVAVGTSASNNAQPPPTPPPTMPLPPVPIPTHGNALGLQAGSAATPPSGASLSTLSFTSSSSSAPIPATAPPPLPQLAPGWVFPRNPEVRRSLLPPPKTDRQMDIHDRKVRLQGKLIGMQGWGNVHASESDRKEIEMLKEQIKRLEILESSEWAMGRSDEFPAELAM